MSNVKKKIEVVMLATNKTGILSLRTKDNLLYPFNITTDKDKKFISQHLYFLSDEPIKDKDYAYHKIDNKIILITKDLLDGDIRRFGYKKVIATTDECLIIGNKIYVDEIKNDSAKCLPSPSPQFIDKFIEEYNRGNVIKEVMVEYEGDYDELHGGWLADTMKPKTDKNNHITITRCKDYWSREEVKSLIWDCLHTLEASFDREKLTQFINQNL